MGGPSKGIRQTPAQSSPAHRRSRLGVGSLFSPLLAPLIQKGFMSADFADALRLCTLPSCSLTALIQSNRRVTYKQVNPFDYQFGSSQKFY